LPGVLGRSVLAVWRRLHPDTHPQPARIHWSAVHDIGSAITLSIAVEGLPNQGLETWARTQIVAKLPGASHAPE
jgi:hypothetical protein